jgi:N utilization substance protein B
MPLPPQKFREAVFQLLYSSDFLCENSEETMDMLMAELKITRKAVSQARAMVEQIFNKIPEIDAKIADASTEYRVDRISRVEKTILRLGLYELLCQASLPHPIVMAEAIRLTRKFGTPESAQFVNAILDRVYIESQKSVADVALL